MAITIQNFINLANFYNQTMAVMSAICVQKGGIALENYTGRFYAADVLEFVAEYGRRAAAAEPDLVTPQITELIDRFTAGFDRVRSLTTPTQKPIHEMTLAEFERVMNI